tara:strand:+ start:67 stop:504 length:438 start_codon:yes stop_codon:yes gene_type:complete
MVKNIFLYIFIYVLCIGCESSLVSCNEDCYIDTSAPSLEIDENGYYHIEWLDGYVQTFSTLEVKTGVEHQKVIWMSNKEINIQYNGKDNWINLVNKNSYTNNEGIAHTTLGVWKEFMGDTIKVYCGYTSECGVQYLDSLEVIVWQ